MTQNRKRGRNVFTDEVEFMPLSKRINNLHINGNLLLDNVTGQPNASLTCIEWGPGPPYFQSNIPVQNHISETPPTSVQNLEYSSNMPRYDPELTERQNPHYFNINKLLYEMYIERSLRQGSNF